MTNMIGAKNGFLIIDHQEIGKFLNFDLTIWGHVSDDGEEKR